jgi:hypothetical protein
MKSKKMKKLKRDAVIEIPKEVAVCPICGARLYASCDSWVEEGDEEEVIWKAESLNIDCETEPDIKSDEWEDWMAEHYSMPYVDWLPVECHIVEWVNKHFEWMLE